MQGCDLSHAAEFSIVLKQYWERFTSCTPEFSLPESVWGQSIPVALHGDEGRGRLKQPVMVMSVQPILPLRPGKTNMAGPFRLNSRILFFPLKWRGIQDNPKHTSCSATYSLTRYLRPTLCTRLLYSILPAPYSQTSLYDLLRAWTEDLNSMHRDGITVSPLNLHKAHTT